MRITQVVAVVLGVLSAPVVLALTGLGWLVAAVIVVVATVILGTEIAAQRAMRPTGDAIAPVVDPGRVRGPEPGAGGAEEPVQAVACTDEELRWAWRRSFAQLQRTTDPDSILRLVAQRQGYLDELERRHPTRFAAWISSGARAAGDPHPFIRPRRTC